MYVPKRSSNEIRILQTNLKKNEFNIPNTEHKLLRSWWPNGVINAVAAAADVDDDLKHSISRFSSVYLVHGIYTTCLLYTSDAADE